MTVATAAPRPLSRKSLAPPPTAADAAFAGCHLTTLGALERHAADPRRPAGYERLLADFGIDAAAFAAVAGPPRLVLAEQTGCWLWGDDLLRFRLLQTAARELGWERRSGALSFAHDGFDWRGVKRYFVTLHLHPAMGFAPLLGATHLRRHRHRAYHALRLVGSSRRRVVEIFDAAETLIGAAAVSAEAFARAATTLLSRGLGAGVRSLLPAATGRRALLAVADELRRHDLAAALQPLTVARHELDGGPGGATGEADGVGWRAFWDCVDGAFLGTEVGDLAPLFNRFLLTVADPVRMSRHLAHLTAHPPGEPIAVAAIFLPGAKYRMVYFDPSQEGFFCSPLPGERRAIAWDEVRAAAARGETGGPSGVLEYLLMAASGIYLVSDPEDGESRFEGHAAAIHRLYTALPYPFVALAEGLGDDCGLVQVYSDGFERRWRHDLGCFLR